MSEIRKKIKTPAPDGWQQVADAVTAVRDQIRESFGPQREVRLVTSGAQSFLDSVGAEQGPDAAGRLLAAALIEQEESRPATLKREIRDRVLELCGWSDGAEVTSAGSMDNDLAQERADAVMDMLEQVRGHGFPQAVAPPPEGAPLYALLNALRPLVYRVVNATAADDAELTENVDVIMAFVNLAREHSDPKRLLPRGDRLGGWLPPGTPVIVHLGQAEHRAVVEPDRDMVTVRLDSIGVVTEYPRNLISKEGEPWTPPKPTNS